MNKRLKHLKGELLACVDEERINAIRTEIRYLCSKDCDKVAEYRSQEITKRVVKDYPLDRQIAIILDGDADEIASLKAFRAEKATEVDELIAHYESEVET